MKQDGTQKSVSVCNDDGIGRYVHSKASDSGDYDHHFVLCARLLLNLKTRTGGQTHIDFSCPFPVLFWDGEWGTKQNIHFIAFIYQSDRAFLFTVTSSIRH